MLIHCKQKNFAQQLSNTENAGSTYSNAVGLRAGETSGLTLKHFFSSGNAVEAIIGVWPYACGITGLYEKYVPVKNANGFNFYFGGGGHLNVGMSRSYYVYRADNRYYTYRYNYPGLGLGLDGIAGLEYKIPAVPIAFSLDLKPFIEFSNWGMPFTALDPGFGIKFTF